MDEWKELNARGKTTRKRDEREREKERERKRRCEEEDMERRPPSDDDDNNRGGRGKVFGSEANRGRRGNANNTDDAGNNGDGETVEVFGGDVWSSGAVLALVIAWMFKAATERCTC